MKKSVSSKKAPLRVSYLRAALVSAISIAASWLFCGLAFVFLHTEPEILREMLPTSMVLCTIIPLMVSFPVAIILQRERLRLTRALNELEAAHSELARRARIDTLTSLLNRDAFLSDVERLKSQRIAGSMLMIDVDHFKTINDSYGHQAGDQALTLVASAIRKAIRQHDVAGRLGGEEFGVFVADENLDLGCQVAERIRRHISQIQFEPRPGVFQKITASVGVAQGEETSDLDAMIRNADHSLYAAKDSGRDRVEVFRAA